MRKILLTVIVCVVTTAVLVTLGYFSFPLHGLVVSLVSTAMFIGFSFLLRAASPKVKTRKFFRLSGVRFADCGFILSSTAVLVAGTFLLNILTSVFCRAVGLDSSVSALSEMNSDNYLLILITVAIVPAFTEEFFFRGAVLSSLREKGPVFSVAVSAVLFMIMHGLDIYFLSTLFAGVVLAFVALVTKSVFAAAIVHLINNILTYILWRYAERLFAVELEAILIYAAVFILLIGAVLIVSSAIRRLKKEMYKKRSILNEGEVVWAKNQEEN